MKKNLFLFLAVFLFISIGIVFSDGDDEDFCLSINCPPGFSIYGSGGAVIDGNILFEDGQAVLNYYNGDKVFLKGKNFPALMKRNLLNWANRSLFQRAQKFTELCLKFTRRGLPRLYTPPKSALLPNPRPGE